MKLVGRWINKIRKVGETEWQTHDEGEIDWGYNQIQNTFATLLASLCRDEHLAEPYHGRIAYMAIGSGLVGWDASPPAQPYANTTLTTEYFRKFIPQADIVFIDPITNIATGGVPSSKLEITVELLSVEANGTLREFGLFGGDGTISLDSGDMVNWIVHSKIVKDSSLEIQRIVRLEFVTL